MKPFALKQRVAAIACAVAGLFAVSSVHAQPLADRVPDTALVYAGWAGASALNEKMAGTHLKAILDESRMKDLFGSYLDQAQAKVVGAKPEAAEAFRIVRKLGSPMWHHPTAVYIDAPLMTDPKRPAFRMAILSQAGSAAEGIADEINQLLVSTRTPADAKARAVAAGEVVCFSIGYDQSPLTASGNGTLAHDAAFTSALSRADADPALIFYGNVQAVLATAQTLVGANDADAAGKVNTFLDASGLKGVQAFVQTQGFEGKDWVTHTFVNAPSPRAGILADGPAGAIDADLLRTIPADASFAAAGRFDVAKFLTEIRASLGKTDPKAQQGFNMGVSAIQQALGVNPISGIFEPLGSDWALYASPTVSGSGLAGTVLVNKLDDPDRARRGLTTAAVNLTNWINVAINRGARDSGISVHTARTTFGDIEVNYFATPILAPSWAIADGRLYLGLFPQTVGAAARQARADKPSLVDAPRYQALVKRLGGQASVEGFSFFDLPASAGHSSMYGQWLLLTRYAGFGDLWGLTLPEPFLPPMDVLSGHLDIAGSVSWRDDAGLHCRAVTPFPGATLLVEQGAITAMGPGSAALGASILLPSLNRARETANRVKSASNLRMIGTGCVLYANENRGKYPPDFAALIETQDLVPEVFISPRTDNALPAGTMQERTRYIVENGDYVYLGADMTNRTPAEMIIAYEKPDGLDDGINVLFADGHVEFIFMDRAIELIEKQTRQRPGGGLE